ncbi:uncharacterized protein [Epargyreus clarus]|uniref:uncharacterized protein isoform X2 n=1 Tax=Epargyreus clarus TaxID=520877 RepID=UPI003C2D4243
MPYTRAKPVSACESSEPSDEASKLETYLQRQLEEDVASDAYTECDIKNQESEIITYLQNNIQIFKCPPTVFKTREEDCDVFLTPRCISPYAERKCHKSAILSPSTELTREYYALVPIEGNLLEQELNEQDALSNAFQSIIKNQDTGKLKISPRSKPTSLCLSSSHIPKTVKHSSSCDNIIKYNFEDEKVILPNDKKVNAVQSQTKLNHTARLTKPGNNLLKNSNNCESATDKVVDPAYSPDSLIADDPSSSSDYLSATYAGSPGLSSSSCLFQLNVGDNITKMENIFTSSDSGLENTGMLESLNSHKDVTLTDVSLTESTLHELTADDNQPHVTTSSQHQLNKLKVRTSRSDTSPISGPSSERSGNGQIHSPNKIKDITKSSKEEKQRQNEEIVIMESSSVSSETGSWESVFPPRLAEKEICEVFINAERQFSYTDDVTVTQTVTCDDNVTVTQTASHPTLTQEVNTSMAQNSPHKSTACFIDAANLVDEDDKINVTIKSEIVSKPAKPIVIPIPSQPVPCSMVHKLDISPNDWSESNDNDDSLEQADIKEHDSVHRDLSPTIFEMTPITEDSLSTNPFDKTLNSIEASRAEATTSTPYNSIMSFNTCLKQLALEESENDTVANTENQAQLRITRCNEFSPIVYGGATIEDSHASRKSPKSSNASAWVVDMSFNPKNDASAVNSNISCKKPADRVCESLKHESKYDGSDNCNKSRGSVDSDSSEKSSHKFYIDLSSLPDPLPKNNDAVTSGDKKNMFSMYIDLGENSTLKEMPSRLSSSLNTKKPPNSDNKSIVKLPKVTKAPLSECIIPTFPKIFDQSDVPSTFETYETLCNDPNMSISEIIALPKDSQINKTISRDTANNEKWPKNSQCINGEKSFFSVASNVIQEEASSDHTSDLFVKLSDLDKPVHKADLIHENKEGLDVRMTRSIPENNWGEQSHAVSSRSIEVISSFHSENALSLNRLFPHLKNEFSKSMPGSLSGRTRSPLRQGLSSSPGELEEQVSDVSEMSSVQSSICRSVVENSTTETSQTSSLIGNCQSRLGQDLLRMFLEEIAPDVIVEVSGKRIKAHKCILSSRCQYFAGILSGGWVESAGNVIVLPPFSFNVAHFALCHIYSGVSTIPDSISIVELATIADMLGLEGLKEAIMFTLKAKYCHHFHRPCQVCTAGVLECFPLSSVYGLDDLYRKCLRWITKYFSKVWPTKSFATLPKELLDKCYQEHIVNLSTENLIDTVYGCGVTVSSLQNTRWAESVARMCRRLVNAAAHFAAPRLVAVLRAVGNMSPDAPHAAKQALDDCLAAAIEWAPPDETCRAYAFLCNLVKEMRTQHYYKPDVVHNGGANQKSSPQHNLLLLHASSWRLQCEGALVRAAPRVVGTQAFKDLPSDLRKRLRELGCIMYGAQAIAINTSPFQDRKCRSTYTSKPSKPHTASTSQSLDMEHVRASFVPYKPKPIAQIGPIDKLKSNSELRDIKKAIKVNPPKVRTTKAQEERAKFNQTKTNQSQERVAKNKVPPRLNAFENTKPRYLEPRPCKEMAKKAPTKKHFLSSSESSRNSSPVLARNARTSRIKAKAQAMSQDSLATPSRPRTAEPSTDSLSESQTSNKYGTYTKARHTSKGSVESIKSPKYQNPPHTSALNNKAKTKIPVYSNQCSKFGNGDVKEQHGAIKRYAPGNKAATNVPVTSKLKTERKLPGSLMNATKSSSAKMVPKIVKESQQSKASSKQQKHAKNSTKQEEQEKPIDIPVMGRSGTFLKDEPMFGDKATDIDATP